MKTFSMILIVFGLIATAIGIFFNSYHFEVGPIQGYHMITFGIFVSVVAILLLFIKKKQPNGSSD